MSYAINTATHFVLPRADIGKGKHPMIKAAEYFKFQDGLTKPWGRNWVPVIADGPRHAYLLAWFIGSGTGHPTTAAFTPPNTRTVGEILGETA